ncbi:unnamed protein product [Brachionus calyciflorus]|uniref:HAT C-terminal dimerisation domain-containing protein n=1 Tax=Brachionus calyciflorus TaxID=104777 RepID=A0A813VNE2_9BILA|nr:unnamed protein product [Brachionus calyciflorus]
MLFSILKANKAGLFGEENLCPVDVKDLEIYMQILKPVFVMSTDIQAKFSNISIIVPSVLMIVYGNLDRMICSEQYHDEFRKLLMKHIISKFDYELNSKIYLVASVLNVITHSWWKKRSFCISYFEKGLKFIREVVVGFKKINENEQLSESMNDMSLNEEVFPGQNQNSKEDDYDGLIGLKYFTRSSLNSVTETGEFSKKVEKEVFLFKSLISEKKITSTKTFWLNYSSELPNLYELSLRLLSILCTSSEAERFFSEAGRFDKNLLINQKNC